MSRLSYEKRFIYCLVRSVNQVTKVWFLNGAGHFVAIDHVILFYGHLHCTSFRSGIYRSYQFLKRKWRQLVLLNCSTVCPGTMWWLNYVLVNSMWLPERKLPTPQPPWKAILQTCCVIKPLACQLHLILPIQVVPSGHCLHCS
jgi:hypothetical protein